jgi:hypothetical protein
VPGCKKLNLYALTGESVGSNYFIILEPTDLPVGALTLQTDIPVGATKERGCPDFGDHLFFFVKFAVLFGINRNK